MRSHFMLGRGVAMACAAAGATAIPAGVCSAAIIASDSAIDPAYADGWQVGDNGGTGLGPWDMTGTAATPVQRAMDSTSPYNQLGRAWTLYNPNGPPSPQADNPNPPEDGTDLSQAGAPFPGRSCRGRRSRSSSTTPRSAAFSAGTP